MNELSTEKFDYSLVSDELEEKIKEKDYILIGLHSKYSKEVGKVLSEAQQDFSDYNNGGLFEKWYTSKGFKKQNVYNYINIYSEVQTLDDDQLEVFEKLPKSLQVETSKKSIDPEIKQKVYEGDITTHKEYKEIIEAKQQAEKQAEQARQSEEIALKQLEELESKEPETIEKEVIPEHVKTKLFESDKKILETTEELRDTKMKLERLKNQVSYDSESDKKEKELKALQYNADKTVLTTKLRMDEFLKDVAVTSFRKGAIASSSEETQNNLKQGVEELEDFCKEMRIALSGRIDLSKQGVN